MTDQINMYQKDMIKDLGTLISYPSVYSEDEKPFGHDVKACLHAALEIAQNYGFRTCNVDDYCGYIEMGQGEEIVGILAHLDVVPVSNTWATDPFTLTFADGRYYGRGTSDDKGAVICSLTALRMLKPLESTFRKRVRLILGCNEESGSKGIEYYVKKFGPVNCGFTPDGSFPLIYGEKGMAGGLFKGRSTVISKIEGGTVRNAVASKCTVELSVDPDEQKLNKFFADSPVQYSYQNHTLTVTGQAAHASTPEKGYNAISYALEALYYADCHDALIDHFHDLIGLGYNGEKMKVDFKDDYGKLTFNIGLAYMDHEEVCLTIDSRIPVTCDPETVARKMNENGQGYVFVQKFAESLFYPLEHPMIKALMEAYQSTTHDYEAKPLVIGGGTYAKEMPNIVAFGCSEDEIDYHIHDDNEYVTWESLSKQTACYYQAILNLLEL